MRFLFIDDCNGYEAKDPRCALVDVYHTETRIMKALEASQVGAGRMGGSWKKIMEDGNIMHEIVETGPYSTLRNKNYDEEYRLISGNY